MPRKPRGPKVGAWQYQVGEVPVLLTAFERRDKGNAIYTRIWDGYRYRGKRALCPTIRDKAGRIVPELELAAQQKAIRRQQEEASGVEANESRGPLTLAGGFRRLFDKRDGKFATRTGHSQEVERAAKVIAKVLGPDISFDSIRHKEYRKLWRSIAAEHAKDPTRYGLRTAEIYCIALQSTARWLQQEGYLEPGDAVPAPGWKQALRSEWESITGKPVREPEKLRYSDSEFEKLWKARHDADPRIRLVLEIGAELRLGQVARVRRSDVLPHRGFQIGKVVVHGRGKKRGSVVILTREQRHSLTAALLWGYLAHPEAAYRAGVIEDYHLIGGGRLHGDTDHKGRPVKRLRAEGADKPLDRRAMGRQWENLETAAGVPHVEGRLWYGVRRIQADRADALQDVESRVKNRLGGWTKTSTREGYLEGENLRDSEAAAEVRKRIRPKGPDTRKGTKLPPKVTPDSPAGESRGPNHDVTDDV